MQEPGLDGTTGAKPVLEARAITKRFGHVEALRGADFVANSGEITALIGDNGAGKSTLVKILSGVNKATSGEILVGGTPATFNSPADAHAAGVETVYQDLSVAPDLSPSANMFMGRERLRPGLLGRLGFLDNPAMRQRKPTRLQAPQRHPEGHGRPDCQPFRRSAPERRDLPLDHVGQGASCSWTNRPPRSACCRPGGRWT